MSAVICWGSSIRASDLNKVNKVTKKDGLEKLIEERRMFCKLLNMMDNNEYPGII